VTAPATEPLVFPRGVRFPLPDEFPAGYDEDSQRISEANITTGCVVRPHKSGGFAACIEANVHAPDLFAVFGELASGLLPEVSAPLVGLKDEEPFFGHYTDRELALAALWDFREHLQHDGLMEFGIMFQHDGYTEEIFVRSAKYMQIWTNYLETVRAFFERYEIPEAPGLRFIDEYPHVSETIPYNGHGSGCYPVLDRLKERFEALPHR